jgi:YbbR domain-containing protein
MTRVQRLRDWIFSNWPIKLTALVLATVLWAVTAAQETTSQLVPVTLEVQAPEGRDFTSELPQVQARFAGTLRELIKLYESPPIVRKSIPDTIVGTTFTVELNPDDIEVTDNANVIAQELQPRAFTVTLDDVIQRSVRVVSRVQIVPESGYGVFGRVTLSPATVTIQGPEELVNQIESVRTVPLDTGGVRSNVSMRVPIDTTGLGVVRLVEEAVIVAAEIGQESERVIIGVSVALPDPSLWESTPSAVIVTVRGPSSRVIQLTRDSVRVSARPTGRLDEQTVPLIVEAPPGITAAVRPDSAVVRRRTRG